MKKFVLAVVLLSVLGFLILVSGKTEGVSMPLATETIYQDCSPKDKDYGPFSPYCAKILKKQFLLGTRCEVFVVKHADTTGGYGYAQTVEQCSPPDGLEWGDQSLTVKYPEGDVIIPAQSFMGGR